MVLLPWVLARSLRFSSLIPRFARVFEQPLLILTGLEPGVHGPLTIETVSNGFSFGSKKFFKIRLSAYQSLMLTSRQRCQ